MKYYHGSRSNNLKVLSIEKSNDGYVWLTEQYEFALLYAANSLRFWDYDFKTNRLIIREISENSFEKMYKGVECFIYYAEDVQDSEQVNHMGRPSIRCTHDVNLSLYEHIPDAYDKIMELYKKGIIELKFWENYTLQEKEYEINKIINSFYPIMRIEKEKAPAEYNLLVELRPELKIEE